MCLGRRRLAGLRGRRTVTPEGLKAGAIGAQGGDSRWLCVSVCKDTPGYVSVRLPRDRGGCGTPLRPEALLAEQPGRGWLRRWDQLEILWPLSPHPFPRSVGQTPR